MAKQQEMSEEAKALRREYQRRWRAKNPQKIRAYAVSYWERKAQRERGDKE